MTLKRKVRRASARLLGSVACAASVGILMSADTAMAGIALGVGPNYPAGVTVNQTGVLVSLSISNNSADDPGNLNVDSQRSVTVDRVYHTPACDVSGTGTCPSGSREPSVFHVVGPGTGTGGQAGCAGSWTVGAADPATGEVELIPPAGAGTLVLGPSGGSAANSRCTVVFSVNVLNLPAHDADPVMSGLQTIELGRGTCHFTESDSTTGSGSGSDKVTVAGEGQKFETPVNPAPAMSSTFLMGSGIMMLLWGARRVTARKKF